jgi:hypothetical protein
MFGAVLSIWVIFIKIKNNKLWKPQKKKPKNLEPTGCPSDNGILVRAGRRMNKGT